jgi:arabinogalactan endo-1,4-beta-galactosidase
VQSEKQAAVIKFEATGDELLPGSTDIHTVQPAIPHPVSIDKYTAAVNERPVKPVGKMLGADISFLPQLEDRGIKFSDKGVEKDAIAILKDHGFNYIRLRIFNDPARDSGYSPKKGFCDLAHTLQMAKRVKAAGMKLLLDFHYSDYWADPGKQYKPAAWRNESFSQLKQSVYLYTKDVLQQLKSQGTLPDMVQVGNEINHGMIWPEGSINNTDSLAQLVYAGIAGVKAIDPHCVIMLHIALGGQNDESHYFIDNMLERGVPFDVIGLSYYPKWHGTLADLKYNVNDLARRYGKDIIIVEYSQFKREVNEIAFSIANGRGKGSCIWEPLNTWEAVFEKNGQSNDYLLVYDEIAGKFIKKTTTAH